MPASLIPPKTALRPAGGPDDVLATRAVDMTPPPGGKLSAASVGASALDEVEEATRAYRRFRMGSASDREFLTAVAAVSPATGLRPEAARVFIDLHDSSPDSADRLAAAVTAFPEIGTEFLGFHLESELGRGAFGRVYLARQGELAGRPIALKVAADLTGEPQTLARSQHTNIMPVYSVHRSGPLQAVCMPLFGSVTLDDVVGELRGRKAVPGSGEHFVSTLNQKRSTTPGLASGSGSGAHPIPAADPAKHPRPTATNEILTRLSKLSYADAVLWMGARLADGLGHAHDRGIIHRDLKPANVLLTDEGQPMLLDFNLADDAKARAGASVARVGGTLPYMSPEQMEAFRSRTGTIDGRSDIYALGLILFELLAGRHPFTTPPGPGSLIIPQMIADRRAGPPRLREFTNAVTPAAEAIVLKCLAPDPAQRYQSAHDLKEDIERHLANLPLRHTREPSVKERMRKWTRRNPRLSSTGAVATLATILIVGLASGAWARADALARHEANAEWQEFEKDKRALEETLGGGKLEPGELDSALAAARTAIGRYGLPDDDAWQTRPAVVNLPEADQKALRIEVGELLLQMARATDIQAERGDPADRRNRLTEALRFNELATTCFRPEPPQMALPQRNELRARLEGAPWTEHDWTKRPPKSPRDAYLIAADLAARGKYREALPHAEYVVGRMPDLFPAQFTLANCYAGLGRDEKAAATYSVCIALAPESQRGYQGRGRVRLRQEDWAGAEADFTEAIRLRADAASYIGLARARHELGDVWPEVSALIWAMKLGANPAHVRFPRTPIPLTDDAKAVADKAARARLGQPNDELGYLARALDRYDTDPAGSLADFDAAMKFNPMSRDALQGKAHVLSEKLRRTDDAVRVLDGVLEIYPEAANARLYRGALNARLGKRTEALMDAAICLRQDDAARTAYGVAKIYAQTARVEPKDRGEALKYLAQALQRNYELDRVRREPDFDPIRDDTEFHRIVDSAMKASEKPAPGE